MKVIAIILIKLKILFFVIIFLFTCVQKSYSEANKVNEFLGEHEILKYAFTKKTIESSLYYEPLRTFEDIYVHNKRIFTPIKRFSKSYKKIKIKNVYEINDLITNNSVIVVEFSLRKKNYKSFAYGKLPLNCNNKNSNNSNKAIIIIPGSGSNQSYEIISGNKKNYHHGILETINQHKYSLEKYIYIKPNEGIRAWHNGEKKKLNGGFIWNWHINRGGSYSASYIVETLALVKYLKKCFNKTILAGLSQGSHAALINSLQSHPDFAIISSGHSILREKLEYTRHNQILNIPGYSDLFKEKKLVKRLKKTPTKFLFSWGLNDNGVNKFEAHTQLTAKKIENLKNIQISIHNLKHNFPPSKVVNKFLED